MTRRLALGLVVFASAPACGDPPGIDEILGVWNTASIGGHTVPGNVVYEGVEYDTEYVRWAFYDGGLCTLTQRVDGLTTTYDQCSYTLNAEQETIAIVFLSETWDGSVDSRSMTLTDPQDVVWMLRRAGG